MQGIQRFGSYFLLKKIATGGKDLRTDLNTLEKVREEAGSTRDHSMTLANPRLKIRRQVNLHIESNKTTSIIIDFKEDPPVKETVR